MFKLALVALFCTQAFANPNEGNIESRVLGGSRAPEEYNFSISLRVFEYNFPICGGALISDKFVLTTARCAEIDEPFKVAIGSVDLAKQKLYEVDKIMIHPKYDSLKYLNDIALIKLKTPVKLGGNITTIDFNLNVTEKLEGKNVTVLGYGRTYPDGPFSQFLMYLSRPVINSKDCSSRLHIQVADSMFCTKGENGKGMCHGDHGSPVTYKAGNGKTYLAGLFTYGLCEGDGHPDLFTKVSPYAQWIKQNMV